MKVLMTPHLNQVKREWSGVGSVIRQYFKRLPGFGVELVGKNATSYDLKAVHAGMTGGDCDVAHLHGIYFTTDYDADAWEYAANAKIVEAVRMAKTVTVPSSWVQETFQRDMRFSPAVVPHGIDWQDWQHTEPNEGYILGYAKNRIGDVCDPGFLPHLALRFPKHRFLATFAPDDSPDNIATTGVLPHPEMKRILQRAAVYISPVKETFGVMTLEAMASGVPVLGFAYGGNLDLVQHGVNGYLTRPGDYEDLAVGLNFCLKYRDVLGGNGREMAKTWTWEAACQKLVEVYEASMVEEPPTVGVVIPVYNKTAEQINRAIKSCLNQTYRVDKIVVVIDGNPFEFSTYDKTTGDLVSTILQLETSKQVEVIEQSNLGVANARNRGVSLLNTKYVCCLDADDAIEPEFIETCVDALEADPSLGITYTGLRYIKPDGEEGLSPWPGEWDYNKTLKGQNQIPTCNVARREVWQRLGGQRQRYAPDGAGEEDAEMWLRAGAYGWKAAKVSDEGLFIYSWQSGLVSGNKEHRITDYRAWHPWVKDGLHPLASYATPKGKSHPVTQYDQPVVSVIIPVGPGHEGELINALDSLEAQTFRWWEAIVIWDGHKNSHWYDNLITAYPYIRDIATGGKKGSGYARNRGVEIARAPFLLFLDADDTLHPDCLQMMLEAWGKTEKAIYTDYVGQAFIEPELAKELEVKNRLQYYKPETGEAIISYKAFPFECERALRQPNDELYIWNLITTLIPRKWHDEIGGFDETMPTWEDWDYWLRVVRADHCFYHLEQELVRYRFYTGQRRSLASADTDTGRQAAQDMIKYLAEKYGDKAVGCDCGASKNGAVVRPHIEAKSLEQSHVMSDQDFVKCRYNGPDGNHHIIGAYVFEQKLPNVQMKPKGNGWVLYYGYRSKGAVFLVHKEDVRLMVGKFEPITEKAKTLVVEVKPPLEPSKIAVWDGLVWSALAKDNSLEPIIAKAIHLADLPGVTTPIAREMVSRNLVTVEAIKTAGIDGLTEIKGIGRATAEKILAAL